ncbi:AAA family ATPase [Macrococcus capreoli]
MNKYIRKLFPHDINKQISITKKIQNDFFGNAEVFEVIGMRSGKNGKITILSATDPRFGGDIKKILSEEGNFSEEDIIIFTKNGSSKYYIELITKDSDSYNIFNSFFNNNERHSLLFFDEENEQDNEDENKNRVLKGKQRIFFGAPGTGKSYKLNCEAKDDFKHNYDRVTFHPNYSYGNFVGSFKPFPKIKYTASNEIKTDEDGNIIETITYDFIPGILIKVLERSYRNVHNDYLLIIEEINRANVSAVFGDLFQLLDRDNNGESEYYISTSKELQSYLKREHTKEPFDPSVVKKLGENFEKLYFPSNLFIWATMNSADQGVMPLDTAFKRRWDFEYLGINETADENRELFENYFMKINSTEKVKWDTFRRNINERLSKLNIPEDKLLGPYFISKSVLESDDIQNVTNVIKNKVLMYLYDDAAKAYRNILFAEGNHSTFSALCRSFEENALDIFKERIQIESSEIISVNFNNVNVEEKNNENSELS